MLLWRDYGKAISNEVMNLLGENPATELEDINQEIADL